MTIEDHGSIYPPVVVDESHLLTWSTDPEIREIPSGRCVSVFKGHTSVIAGAAALPDGRLASWSFDRTIRVWDRETTRCLAILVGREFAEDADIGEWGTPRGAIAFGKDRLLSWAHEGETDNTDRFKAWLRLWDLRHGQGLVVVPAEEAARLHPSLWIAYAEATGDPRLATLRQGDAVGWDHGRSAGISINVSEGESAGVVSVAWHAYDEAVARHLLADGTLVVTLKGGDACVLKLHQGASRIGLDELASR